MKNIKSASSMKLAALGVALAVSGAAFATDTWASARHHDHAGHHQAQAHSVHHGLHKFHGFHHGNKGVHGMRHGHFQRAGLMVPGYGIVSRDFIDGMGLNDDQLKLIEEAREAAKSQRENRRERLKTQREARAELFKADALDPEQALKQADERRAQLQAERRAIDEKWIAVWRSFDADQQARVTTHLKDRAQKAQQRAEKLEERQAKREAAKAEAKAANIAS